MEVSRIVDSISIHAPTRGATCVRSPVFSKLCISIHAPTRGATNASPWVWVIEFISIHAPTRGATFYLHFIINNTIISIHAPTRGATRAALRNITQEQFQSTLLQEERLDDGEWMSGSY